MSNQQPIGLDTLVDPFLTGLIYGRNGVGKTAFAAGSQYLRTFIFDVDAGSMTLQSRKTDEVLRANGYPTIKRELVKLWPVHPKTAYADFMNGMEWCVKYQNQYDLAVIDTATELQRAVGAEIKKTHNHKVADQRDWGLILDAMETICREFRTMKKHSLFLCHETTVMDPNTGYNVFRPNFKGAFAGDYGRHFSLIARYFLSQQTVLDASGQGVEQTIHLLNCRPDAYTDAKDRSSSLDKFEYPILDSIMYKIAQAVNPTNVAAATL